MLGWLTDWMIVWLIECRKLDGCFHYHDSTSYDAACRLLLLVTTIVVDDVAACMANHIINNK